MIGLAIVTIILISIGIVLIKYSNKVSKEPPKKSRLSREKKNSSHIDKEFKHFKELIWGAITIFVIFIIFKLVTMAYEGTTGFFSDKADRKDRCRTSYSVKNAKTEFAAKQAYKACMRD